MALLPIAALLVMQGSIFSQPDVVRPLPIDYLRSAEVVRVSPRPTVASGIIMVTTDFDVRAQGGALYTMTMIYGGEDQFIPPVGSICMITFIPGRILGDFGLATPNQVQELRCDTGADGMPIWGARIIGVSSPPPSARRVAFVSFDIESPGRTIRRLYLLRDGRDLPVVGQTCALTYHGDWVTGRRLGMPRLEGAYVRVVDELSCETLTAAAG